MPFLDVGQGHTMYFETHGNPRGKPVVLLHGGPGGGLTRKMLQLFQLSKWYVILYDQRGCGKSTPRLELKNNTTWHLVEDLEVLRNHLHIDKWCLYGGSWGTTLALAYATKHLEHISAFVLRGVCLFTEEENKWMFEKGYVSEVYPNAWSNVTKPLRKGTRKILPAYHKLLKNPETRRNASKTWSKYESNIAHLLPRPFEPDTKSDEESAVLETYYFINNAWITPELLLKVAKRIRVPVILVHGRYDMICPASSAELLKDAIPQAKLLMIADAGHATNEKGIFQALRKEIRGLNPKI